MAEWFEDEAFWKSLYPFTYPEERFQIVEEEIEKILKLVDFKGHSVLDLCCGPGRHSIALAKKGLAVTGVDRSPFLLAKAVTRAEEQNVEVEWVEEDMRYFARREAFDLVLNMFTSFGYFDNKEDDLKVLQNIHQSLRPSGICLLDIGGKEWLAKVFQPTTNQEGPAGSLLVRHHEIFDDWTRIRNDCILDEGGQGQVVPIPSHNLFRSRAKGPPSTGWISEDNDVWGSRGERVWHEREAASGDFHGGGLLVDLWS